MADYNTENINAVLTQALTDHWKSFFVQGLVLMALGITAAALPAASTLTIEVIIGSILVVAGTYRILVSLSTRSAPGFWHSLIGGSITLLFGASLFLAPAAAAFALTTVLAILFIAQGLLSIGMALRLRTTVSRWVWIAASGTFDLILAFMIIAALPAAADWILGLLLGVNLIVLGVALAAAALEFRPR